MSACILLAYSLTLVEVLTKDVKMIANIVSLKKYNAIYYYVSNSCNNKLDSSFNSDHYLSAGGLHAFLLADKFNNLARELW